MAVENEWKKIVPPPSRKALILLIPSPKRKKTKISAEASEVQETHKGGSKMGGNYSDGFCATSPSNNRTVYFDT